MLQIQTFIFNPFQVNTYVLYDDTKECVIIDPASYGSDEEKQLQSFITEQQLTPKYLLNTHCHIDHILGNNFVAQTYQLKPVVHRAGLPFLAQAKDYGSSFGFNIDTPVQPVVFLEDGQKISFGNQTLQVLYAPGHADGSVCFYHEKEAFVIVGDVLFNNSIGRTDLPTGDYDTLIRSIHQKLMVLPEHVKVFCGHGPATSIEHEKEHNPYLNN